MRVRRETKEIFTVIILLILLIIFNIAIIILDDNTKKGRPKRVNAQTEGSRIQINRIMQEVVK